jgi:tetratricopeptide (TPR) repeat protein
MLMDADPEADLDGTDRSTSTSRNGKQNTRRAAGLSRTIRAGIMHHEAGRLDRAEGLYRKVLEKDPNHADALHHLGVIAYQCGKIGVAIQLIERALPALTELPDAHLNLGNALGRAGRLAEAVESYHRAIALKPDYGMAHSNLARALNDQGLFEAGLASAMRAGELIPDFLGVHINCAAALMGLDRSCTDRARSARRCGGELPAGALFDSELCRGAPQTRHRLAVAE